MPPWMMGCSMPNNSVMAVFTENSCVPAGVGSMGDFERSGGTPAAAAAHGADGMFRLAPPALDQRGAGQASTGHAIGMADGNRTAVDVELVRVDAELVAAIDHLHREGFVELPEIDVVDLQAVPLEQPRHGIDRSHAHLVRLAARRDKAAEDAKRLQSLPRRKLVAHDHGRAGAIRKLAGIAGGDD